MSASTTSSALTAPKVQDLFKTCKMIAGAPDAGHTLVEGVTMNVRFNMDAITKNRATIASFLSQLPPGFRESQGGGWTFAMGNVTSRGKKWTKDYNDVEQLFLLGLAARLVKCTLPRDGWGAFNNGVPIYRLTML